MDNTQKALIFISVKFAENALQKLLNIVLNVLMIYRKK